jgi:hypothetical protein
MTDATLAVYTPAPLCLSRALGRDPGRVVRDLAVPQAVPPFRSNKVVCACCV